LKHMTFVGYNVSFSITFLFEEEEGNSHNPQALSNEKKQGDIEIFVSTIDQHRQRERNENENNT